jgi:hypothetical protein
MIYMRLDHVDHRLGKGEVVSSILPGSTSKATENQRFCGFQGSTRSPFAIRAMLSIETLRSERSTLLR